MDLPGLNMFLWMFPCFILLCSFVYAENAQSLSLPITVNCTEEECGRQLFLTSYLKNGKISEGREAARVLSLVDSVESYSGYFTVDEKHDSNMFFWFFPSETNKETAPLVLWLEGGPGGSSLPDTFSKIGPYLLDDEGQITHSNLSWTQSMNVLFIDNPVGVGFSVTRDSSGYSVNQDEVRSNLYTALIQFFQLFPEYQKNEFFISGISYAGKYIPSLAYSIHENNPTATIKINLKGIAIGNGLVDTINQLGYSQYLYNLGIIDLETKHEFGRLEEQIASLIQAKRYEEASQKLAMYIISGGPQLEIGSLFKNVTGLNSNHNYLAIGTKMSQWPSPRSLKQLFSDPDFRKSVHAGNSSYYLLSIRVFNLLKDDITRSVASWLEVLLDNYRVLVYNGQLDIICAYPMTMNYVYKLKWTGRDEYLAAERRQWHVRGELAGYAKSGGNLTEVLVRDAGHAAFHDRPLWVLDLVQKFLKNDPIGAQ